MPRDCYAEDVTYPLDDSMLLNYDGQKFNQAKAELQSILEQGGKEQVEVCTPLFGTYDPDIHETSNELGVAMLQNFNNVIGNFVQTVTSVSERREQNINK